MIPFSGNDRRSGEISETKKAYSYGVSLTAQIPGMEQVASSFVFLAAFLEDLRRLMADTLLKGTFDKMFR